MSLIVQTSCASRIGSTRQATSRSSDLAIIMVRPITVRPITARPIGPSWSTAEGQFQPRGYATD
jgi:hypothetical protein